MCIIRVVRAWYTCTRVCCRKQNKSTSASSSSSSLRNTTDTRQVRQVAQGNCVCWRAVVFHDELLLLLLLLASSTRNHHASPATTLLAAPLLAGGDDSTRATKAQSTQGTSSTCIKRGIRGTTNFLQEGWKKTTNHTHPNQPKALLPSLFTHLAFLTSRHCCNQSLHRSRSPRSLRCCWGLLCLRHSSSSSSSQALNLL